MSNTRLVSKRAKREWMLEYKRLTYRGQHRDWWIRVRLKAGVPLAELARELKARAA